MTPTAVLLAATLVALCWAATCVRLVPAGTWLAVSRYGVVRRLRSGGLAVRLPFVERFEAEVERAREVPVHVRATTADGVPVHVLARATVVLPAPAIGRRYDDPWRAAELAAEETIARSVAGWKAAALTQTAACSTPPLRHSVGAALSEHGVQVEDLTLVEVDVPLHGSR